MSAVSPADFGGLTHIEESGFSPQEEKLPVMITSAPSGLEGEGFPVKRAFAGVGSRYLDPFVHMDQMGSVRYEPGQAKGTPWHPHRGFETVTYMIDGVFEHHDSTGKGGLIAGGDTQWMTAGSGILHIETPPLSEVLSGGLFHGIQLWVNLPAKDKFIEPKYQDIKAEHVKMLSSKEEGALVRVIAGDMAGEKGPGVTKTPIVFLHASIHVGERLILPWGGGLNCLVYVLSGKGLISSRQTPINEGQLAVMSDGGYVELRAIRTDSVAEKTMEVILLGGEPIGEKVVKYGPFVMNTMDEIKDAFDDYAAGKFGKPIT